MNDLLYLECPCSSFPRSFARDYKETYYFPPPSTIYGFLLSLVGETDLTAHLGVNMAIGIIGDPPVISRIVRLQRHHKFSKTHAGTYPSSQFSKPNHQELLTDLKIVIRLDSSQESASVKLLDRVAIALSTPEQITRFGGLSLGESWALVNGIRNYRPSDGVVSWLVKDQRGLIGLPLWIDRQTGQGTFQRFTLIQGDFTEDSWLTINSFSQSKETKSKTTKKRTKS
jgi:CRISPR-associated protein Cas5t